MTNEKLEALYDKIVARFEGIGQYKDTLYYHDLDDEEDLCDYDSSIYQDIVNLTKADKCFHGRTKLVLEFDDISNYVVKIPLKGGKRYYSLYDDENDDCEFIPDGMYEYTGACEFIENLSDASMNIFEHCDIIVDNDDYCAAEASLYNIACEIGVQEFFAGTWFLCEIDGVFIYVSEKAINNQEKRRMVATNALDRIQKDDNFVDLQLYSMEYADICHMGKTHTYAAAIKFADFIVANSISDLHADNIGVTNDGKTVVVDYSGFNE